MGKHNDSLTAKALKVHAYKVAMKSQDTNSKKRITKAVDAYEANESEIDNLMTTVSLVQENNVIETYRPPKSKTITGKKS